MNLAPFFSGRGVRSQIVEIAKQRFRDDAILRLARIANGAEPDYENGNPKDEEKGRSTARRKPRTA